MQKYFKSKALRTLIFCLVILSVQIVQAQERDPFLDDRLEVWQDMKFGLFVHWGIYSQWGCVESWPLVGGKPKFRPDTLKPWIERGKDLDRFRTDYWNLYKTFNPQKFDPSIWAQAASYAGMRYVMFTTRHHDGFSMFDSKVSDYKITSPDCPFSKNPKADIAAEVFKAFGDKGFAIGAYYSPADWHNPGYWDPNLPRDNPNCNYKTSEKPAQWDAFRKYVQGQIEELTTRYGRIDILWLDSGWQAPPNEDLKMEEIAAKVRRNQPGILFVKRYGHESYCDYDTPEQKIPDKPLDRPWETCMTMGHQWSYKPNDEYKSAAKLIGLLADIVCKGGNFLLNVGPDANGEFSPVALDRLKEIGDWMAVNSEAIYGTRAVEPYKDGRTCFTAREGKVYLIYVGDVNEPKLPEEIKVSGVYPASGTKVIMLGANGEIKEAGLKWKRKGNGVVIDIPDQLRDNPPCKYAWVLRIDKPGNTIKPLIYKSKQKTS